MRAADRHEKDEDLKHRFDYELQTFETYLIQVIRSGLKLFGTTIELLSARQSNGAIIIEKAKAEGVLLSTKQLAERLNFSTRTIQQFKIEGLPYIGQGRDTRFEFDKVIEWMDKRRRRH